MNKTELVAAIADKAEIKKVEAEKAVKALVHLKLKRIRLEQVVTQEQVSQ